MRSSAAALTIAVAGTLSGVAPMQAQGPLPAGTRWMAPVDSLLSEGDTASAISFLRARIQADEDDPEAVFRLGVLLARTAPTEETDFEQRMEAEELLQRALRLRPDDPSVLVERALLLRKQGIRVDADRLLDDALAPERVERLPVPARADALHLRGRILQDRLDDTEYLLFLPGSHRLDGAEGTARCPEGVAYFCYNYSRARDFNSQLAAAAPASDQAESLPPRIEAAYRGALAYDPSHEAANRDLLGLLHHQGRDEHVLEAADAWALVAPDSPYPSLYRGLVAYAREEWLSAEEHFDRAIARFPPSVRQGFDRLDALLREAERLSYDQLGDSARAAFESAYWASADPLYLMPGNERALEHVARVAYAEAHFADPEHGVPGWATDRGLIYLRYGAPEHIWMLPRTVLSQNQAAEATLTGMRDGRWLFWNYRLDAPSFVFAKQLGYRSVGFDVAANAAGYAEGLAESGAATVFASSGVRRWASIGLQTARFRATEPGLVEVAAFALADPDSFQLFDADTLRAGMFVFTPQYTDSASLLSALPRESTGNLVYTFALEPGRYEYSVEALADGSRVAGRQRGTLEVESLWGTQLVLSDLLVADAIVPRSANPGRWTDFSIAASRDLTFSTDEPVHLYFEVYGLTESAAGDVSYELELDAVDAEDRSVLARTLRSLGRLVGGGGGAGSLRFERSTAAIQGVVPEFLSLTLDDAEPGLYRIRIRIRDLASGAVAETARTVRLESPPER